MESAWVRPGGVGSKPTADQRKSHLVRDALHECAELFVAEREQYDMSSCAVYKAIPVPWCAIEAMWILTLECVQSAHGMYVLFALRWLVSVGS